MALRVRLKRRDVVRIGEALIGFDFGDDERSFVLIIDAPRTETIALVKNDQRQTISELMSDLKTGKRPLPAGPSVGDPPKS